MLIGLLSVALGWLFGSSAKIIVDIIVVILIAFKIILRRRWSFSGRSNP